MYGLILTLQILISIVMVVVILIQSGKASGLGSIFGGGTDSLFSAPSGSLFLKKLTAGLAVAFICTTLLLTILETRRSSSSVLQRVGIPQTQQ